MQTGVSRHGGGDVSSAPRKLDVDSAQSDTAAPASPVGVADIPAEDSAGDSGDSCDGDDPAGESGDLDANLTISTGVKGGLKMHESSGDSAPDSPPLTRQNRCVLLLREGVWLRLIRRRVKGRQWGDRL